jgi:tetratricopeptide (TPR) repeat protein
MKWRLVALVLLVCIAHEPGRAAPVSPAAPAFAVYDLDLKLIPQDHRLEVAGTMSVPSQPTEVSELRLSLSGRMRDFKATQILPGGEALPVQVAPDPSVKKAPTVYILKLPRSVPAHERPKLRFSYGGGEQNAFIFSMDGPTYYAAGGNTAWYPQYGGEGRGTGRLRFHLPDGLTVTASGRPGEQAGGNEPTYVIDKPTHLTFIAGRFFVTRLPGPIPVALYALRERAGSRDYLAKLQRVVSGLAAEFGPYPYGNVTLAEVPRPQANDTGFDGVSTEGLIMLSDSSLDEPFSLPFFGHELSHQWWGNLITLAGSKGNAMLDEAMAQLGALRMVEQLEGQAAAQGFRRDGYPGYADFQSAAGYFRMAAAGLDHPLDSLPSGTFVTHELADNKGFLVLDLLARTVGRDRFRSALRDLVREHAFGTIAWDDFLAKVQRHSAADIGWFYRQWFERTGAPDISTSWVQSGRTLSLTLRQSGAAYRLDIPVRLSGEGGKAKLLAAPMTGPEARLRVPVGFRVQSVEIDPDYHILHWTPALREQARMLAGVTKAYFLRSDGKPKEAQAAYEEALGAASGPDPLGVRFRARRGLAVLALNAGRWDDAKQHYLAALEEPNPPVRELPWAYQGLARAAQKLKDAPLLKRAVAGAVAADAKLSVPTGAGVAAERLLSE